MYKWGQQKRASLLLSHHQLRLFPDHLPGCRVQEAVESAGTLDDTQWLVYWLISAFITIIERFAYKVLFRIPMYGEMKLLFLAFLVLPQFNGANALYEAARPYIIDLYNTIYSSAQELKSDDPRAKSAPLATHAHARPQCLALARTHLPLHGRG